MKWICYFTRVFTLYAVSNKQPDSKWLAEKRPALLFLSKRPPRNMNEILIYVSWKRFVVNQSWFETTKTICKNRQGAFAQAHSLILIVLGGKERCETRFAWLLIAIVWIEIPGNHFGLCRVFRSVITLSSIIIAYGLNKFVPLVDIVERVNEEDRDPQFKTPQI